jgi:hypothetical protein
VLQGRRTRTVQNRGSNNVRTSGEIFADGSVIEVVASATEAQLKLLFWQNDRKQIARRIEYRENVYEAVDLHESLRRAIRFPNDAEEFGTTAKLFGQMRILFEKDLGLASPESALLTAWVCSTWFPDCLASPPALMISGPEIGSAITLFRLLGCLCRHSLLLADVNRTGFLSLMPLQPTLLVNQSGGPLKILDLWRSSNHRGVYVIERRGKIQSLVGSRAVFVGMEDTSPDEAIHLTLPALHQLPPLDDKREAEIAKRFQGQLLMYRLRNSGRVLAGRHGVADFAITELARNLTNSVQNENDIVQAMAPVLQSQILDAQARRYCDVSAVIVEIIWASLHEEEKEVTISTLADRTNALLRVRGETLVYSTVEVGWKLRNMGLDRHRNGGGMVLQFSQANNTLVHRLAKQFGLKLPLKIGCTHCVQRETPPQRIAGFVGSVGFLTETSGRRKCQLENPT